MSGIEARLKERWSVNEAMRIWRCGDRGGKAMATRRRRMDMRSG